MTVELEMVNLHYWIVTFEKCIKTSFQDLLPEAISIVYVIQFFALKHIYGLQGMSGL